MSPPQSNRGTKQIMQRSGAPIAAAQALRLPQRSALPASGSLCGCEGKAAALALQPAVPVTLWSPGSQSWEAGGFEFLLRVEKYRAHHRRMSRWVGPFNCIGPAGGGYRSAAKVPENNKCKETGLGKAVLRGQHLPLGFAFMNCSSNLC